MKSKSIVLLSAGLDSTVNLWKAKEITDVVLTITFDYGQKAVQKEIECAKKLSNLIGVNHLVVPLPWMSSLGQSALMSQKHHVPTGDNVKIDEQSHSEKTAKAVWVPNRNGLFLNIAATYAESLNANTIIPGFNKEEAATFPDNSLSFIQAINQSFYFSTANHVVVECFTIDQNKSEIVALGQSLKAPFHLMWPCYFGREKWCSQCESCQRSKRAFQSQNIDMKEYFHESI